MKDFKDILNSGISDELLAAYIDGNTTDSENALIENALNDDSMLSEAYEIVNDSIPFGSSFDWELHKGDFGFWELGLPPVISENELITTDLIENEDALVDIPSTMMDENITSMSDSFYESDDSIDLSDELDFSDDDILDL